MSRLGIFSNHRARERAPAWRGVTALLCLAIVAAAPAHADVCRVTINGADANDGSSWAQATTLQTALGSAACSEVWVAAGVYKPTSGSDRSAAFAIRGGVGVYGGFAGSETAREQRDPAQLRSVLSGDIDGNDSVDAHGITADANDIVGDNSYHVVRLGGDASAATVLDGFIITGGLANGDQQTMDIGGGGLVCYADGAGQTCSPSLRNLVFRGNYAMQGGGVVCVGMNGGQCGMNLRQVAFVGNGAEGGGAMIAGSGNDGSSDIVIENATFSGNLASQVGGLYVIGLGAQNAVALRSVTFADNSAVAFGVVAGQAGTSVAMDDSVMLDASGTPMVLQNVASTTIGRSLITGGCPLSSAITCTGLITGDALLGSLHDAGTMPLYLPSAGSAAIDAVDCVNVPAHDQRGVARPQGARCDIGAAEIRQPRLTVNVVGGGKVSAVGEPAPSADGIVDCRAASGTCTALYRGEPVASSVLLALHADSGQALQSASGCGGTLAAGGFTFTTGALENDCTVDVLFAPPQRHIGGTVTGLLGSGLQLVLNGSETLPISADGTFQFDTTLTSGASYNTTIVAQPQQPTQNCVVVNGGGSVGAGDVGNIVIHCGAAATYTVGGTLSGLAPGASVALSINGGHPLTLAANGAYVFAPRFAPGDSYLVEITAQPGAQHCTLARDSGVIGSADVIDLNVSCEAGGAQLQLSLADEGAYARYGQPHKYRVTLTNSGNGTATNVAIGATLDAAFDHANMSWICVAGAPGASCAANGSSGFADVVTLPPGTSAVWIVSAPIRADSQDAEATFLVHADGASDISDTNTLVLFRDGMDVPYGNGASALDPAPAAGRRAQRGG